MNVTNKWKTETEEVKRHCMRALARALTLARVLALALARVGCQVFKVDEPLEVKLTPKYPSHLVQTF